MNTSTLIQSQQTFFNTNKTKEVDFRIAQLNKIKAILKQNEQSLYDAIYKDFGKSEFETYVTELGLVYHEIKSNIRHLIKWSKPSCVRTGMANFPAKSYIYPEPLGTVLVIGAWNYPYQLSLLPAITALSAGNTVILKPSELPSHSSAIMEKLINENFESNYFHVVQGAVEKTSELLEHRFDKIFFTGSIPVGKIVYQAAAKHLTPVTLELGGKSPTFVMADCDLKMTVKRIVWAKYLNAGQTCIAPDYILVEKAIEQIFLEGLKAELEKYPQDKTTLNDPKNSSYVKIVNDSNFNRLHKLIENETCFIGGKVDKEKRFISPTVIKNSSFEDEIMKDEIFGPILPVIAFTDLDEVIRQVKARPKPLSCYIYSKNQKTIDKLLNEISFGGGAINDSIMHLSNSKLPFGGVGFSGIGSYHGKAGFDTFSHYKSILHKPFWLEFDFKYAPYTKTKLRIIKWLLE
jgi:aldehyde dehydrogenase (NAD+)